MDWVKSSDCSDGACVEVTWGKSSRCDAGTCVEVAVVGEVAPTVGVRNSRDPETTVWFTQEEWDVFLAGVMAGEFRVDTAANVS